MIDPDLANQVNLMRKYKEGRDVDEGDLPFIDELCSVGLMNRGISTRRKKITAIPTGLGLKIIGGFGDGVPYVEPYHPLVNHPLVTIQKLEVVPLKSVVNEEQKHHKTSERFEDIIT